MNVNLLGSLSSLFPCNFSGFNDLLIALLAFNIALIAFLMHEQPNNENESENTLYKIILGLLKSLKKWKSNRQSKKYANKKKPEIWRQYASLRGLGKTTEAEKYWRAINQSIEEYNEETEDSPQLSDFVLGSKKHCCKIALVIIIINFLFAIYAAFSSISSTPPSTYITFTITGTVLIICSANIITSILRCTIFGLDRFSLKRYKAIMRNANQTISEEIAKREALRIKIMRTAKKRNSRTLNARERLERLIRQRRSKHH